MSATARPTTFFARLLNNVTQRRARPSDPEVLVGIDYKGNRYYERIGANVQERTLDGVVLPKRWYFPEHDNEENWDQHIPPEWEAWMRYRRIDAPTEDEINLNLAVAHMKQVNAAKLAAAEDQRRLQGQKQEALPAPAVPDHATAVQPVTEHADYDDGDGLPYNRETGVRHKPQFPIYEDYEHPPESGDRSSAETN